ncbi:alternative ribosome rescue aminoacyl-tRNA hydrolase ArfB [Psychroserpens sp. XS_ASV72]|uniref:alternative ribosome rescue aminoacyl-tRNA hydrolase ArfB n=1 Tax=Psychroserpens sp. XS_ASV72 TaxID=3241293 RepID=UPI003518025C
MFDEEAIVKEFSFKAIRSSGAGGQHVNKTASKVELLFNIDQSEVLSQDQKDILQLHLKHRLTKASVLILQCGTSRSQHKNKEIVIKRCLELLKDNLIEDKERIPTKTPKKAVKKRLENKKRVSQKKANRQPPQMDS